nr:metallophosphoesterase family protein [Candidatus Sigynarchaeota archaeon]
MDLEKTLLERFPDEAIIVSPNIGIPTFLDKTTRIPGSRDVHAFTMNVISPKKLTAVDLEARFQGHIQAVPLLGIEGATQKLRRGTPLPVVVKEVVESPSLMLDSISLADLYEYRKDRPSYMLRHEFFGKDRTTFLVKGIIDIEHSEECSIWLKAHPFVMFDLVQTFPEREDRERVCFHALVVRRVDWTNMRFVQVSDLHLAKRYDEVLGVITDHIDTIMDKIDIVHLRKLFKIKGSSAKIAQEINKEFEYNKDDPLHRRYQNPNNKFRQFILWVNRAADQEDVDFVVITGDIIDYCLKEDVEKSESYDLQDTNWDVFLRLLLNEPLDSRPGPLKKVIYHEEISVPVFTLTGNHDVRLNSYPLSAVGYYKYFGLTYIEAKLYSDPVQKAAMKAIAIDKYSLKSYYQFINPFDDYYVKLGNRLLLVLNSGSDSFINLKSLLMANPGGVGFRSTQVSFAEHIAEKFLVPGDDELRCFFISHHPIVNPALKLKRAMYLSIFRKFLPKKWIEPEYYKESNLDLHGIKDHDIIPVLSIDNGTISKGMTQILALISRFRLIALMGHTHLLREFRLSSGDGKISGEHVEKPHSALDGAFKIFWDDYTSTNNAEFIQKNRPFILQTPSLGLRRLDENQRFGAFRKITVSGPNLEEIQVMHVSDDDPTMQ